MIEIRPDWFEYGSGPSPTPGYMTVDMCPQAHIQLASPEQVFIPVCEPGLATEILSVHFIEHFTRSDVQRLVVMWFEMLRPNGRLITCFPDMARMSQTAIAGRTELLDDDHDISWLLDHVFGAVTPKEQQKLYRHKSFWTIEEYISLLRGVGFNSMHVSSYSRPPHKPEWTTEVWGMKT